MIRFCRNSKLEKSCRVTDILTPDELKEAEKRILLIVQRTSFVSGKDGVTRLVKVKTASGEKLRPVQRLYSLEINAVSSESLRHRALKGTRPSQSTEKNLRNKIADPVKSKVDNQPILNQKTRLGREIKTVKRLDL
ncbi:hypothetical protein CEXT_133151 [Caerostris extrusa]|uniref:Uncharacterized protein n=1 Tax=Caerostris extrusa TaxID=172846 RepID=A0AAV4VB82_CAEEX|nr:hypothetical protein CEXT_133151 [Caerostris extrusa]